jgi:histidine triad (HIT) family protein
MTERLVLRDGAAPASDGTCDFCEIVSGRAPREVIYEDDGLMVFRNALTWTSVMYLIVPKVHMSQAKFWSSHLFSRAASVAVELGETDSSNGFRLVSNFGQDAAQTQPHGHLHLVGGGELGLYMDFPRKGDYWLRLFGKTEYDPERQRQRRRDEERGQREQRESPGRGPGQS